MPPLVTHNPDCHDEEHLTVFNCSDSSLLTGAHLQFQFRDHVSVHKRKRWEISRFSNTGLDQLARQKAFALYIVCARDDLYSTLGQK